MVCGFLTVAATTAVLTYLNCGADGIGAAFKAASSKAPEMGVAAMIVSLITVPVVSSFTKKFDEEHINNVFIK